MRDFGTNADDGVRQHRGASESDATACISATAPSRQGDADRRSGPPARSPIDLSRIEQFIAINRAFAHNSSFS